MSETTIERHVYIPSDRENLPSEAGGGSNCVVCGQQLDAIQSQEGTMGPTRLYHVQPEEVYRGILRAGLPKLHRAILSMAAEAIARMRAEREEPATEAAVEKKAYGTVAARVSNETHEALRRILAAQPHKRMQDLVAEAIGDLLIKHGVETVAQAMPCGWGCGAQLTMGELKHHFAVCPNRASAMRGGLVATGAIGSQ